MAKISVKDEEIEVETRNSDKYSSNFEIEVIFKTPETIDTERCKSADIPVHTVDSKGKMTFSKVQEKIDEFFQEQHPELEICKILSITVIEKNRIKRGSNWN